MVRKIIHTIINYIKNKIQVAHRDATIFSGHASSRLSLQGSSLFPLPLSRTVPTNIAASPIHKNNPLVGLFKKYHDRKDFRVSASRSHLLPIWLFGLTTLGLLISVIIPIYVIEDKTEAAVGTATESTISLSLSSNNITLNLLQPGTYDANNLESGIFGSASTTASVSTTNYTGYTLSITATNHNGSGNVNNYSKLIDSTNVS